MFMYPVQVYSNAGVCLSRMNRFAEAEDMFQYAIYCVPSDELNRKHARKMYLGMLKNTAAALNRDRKFEM